MMVRGANITLVQRNQEWALTNLFEYGNSNNIIFLILNSIWNEQQIPEVWKDSIIVPLYKKGNKTHCSNYRGISLLSTMYKILYNILLSRLTPHAEKIIEDHQCGFRRSRSTTDHIFCIRQILEKKWE